MKTKSDQIRDALAGGDDARAISIASRFHDRGEQTRLYKQAQSAAQNPAFYRQIGKDPDAIIAAALSDMRGRFV